jgi:hypothetical protein
MSVNIKANRNKGTAAPKRASRMAAQTCIGAAVIFYIGYGLKWRCLFMEQATPCGKANTSYKEVKIGNTLYRVTSVFSGEKDLGHTLEQLAVRRAMTELTPPRVPSAS